MSLPTALPTVPHYTLLLADSELASIRTVATPDTAPDTPSDTVVLRLAVAAVEGGYVPGVELVLHGVPHPPHQLPDGDCVGRIAQGAWSLLAATPRTRHPSCPLQLGQDSVVPGPLQLELQLANGTQCVWQAASLVVYCPVGARFAESYHC